MRNYPRCRKSLIEQRNQNSLTHLIKNPNLTMEGKTDLIKERNPYIYVFGERLTAQKPYEDYTDWVKRSYTKEPQHLTTKEEALEYLKNLTTEEQ